MTKYHFDWMDWPSTQKLMRAFAAQEFRFVGGCVRDGLLDRAVTDVDAATPLMPEEVSALLAAGGYKAVPTGLAHGTITAVIDGKGFEITTLRRDASCDGRHAAVEFTDDWRADAARRDFTMNALYLSPQGELFDYFAGETDARAGRVRFIGDASLRIGEDYLRILRFFRFHAHYGQSVADNSALAACRHGAEHIAQLSGERIQHEMLKLLAAPSPSHSLQLMQQAEVLPQVVVGEVNLAALQELEQISDDALLRLAALLRSVTKPEAACETLVKRWKLSNANAKRLERLVVEPFFAHNISESEQKQVLRRLGKGDFADLARLAAAFSPKHAKSYRAMIALAETWKIPDFPLKGADLIAHGMTPGEAVGKKLKMLEKLWEDSGYVLSKAELLKR